MRRTTCQRVLAVASSGGHWGQLGRLAPAFEGHDVAYVTTDDSHRPEVAGARFYAVPDANRGSRLAVIGCALTMMSIVVRERPDVVVSTGAAPGYLAIRCARLVRARTVWIEHGRN